MTEDSEIQKLEHQITKLVDRVSELEEDINLIRAKYATVSYLNDRLLTIAEDYSVSIEENDRVTLELLNAVEDTQNVLSKELDVEFSNKMIGVFINNWVSRMRMRFRNQSGR